MCFSDLTCSVYRVNLEYNRRFIHTNIIDDLLEFCLTEAISILRGIDDIIETTTSAKLHYNHLIVIVSLQREKKLCQSLS